MQFRNTGLSEQAEKMIKFILSQRQHWRVLMEGTVFRIVTNQQVLAWPLIRDIEEKYELEIFDVTCTPMYGIVVSFNQKI